MMTDRLIAQVKRKLNITWEDDDTNARVEDIIESAIPDLIHRLGIANPDFDFSEPGTENTLFLAYCLYEYNHALNEFDDNYSNKIAQVRAKHEVDHHLKNGADSDGQE